MKGRRTAPARRWRRALLGLVPLLGGLGACTPAADGESVRFTVPRGASVAAVADTLARRDLVRNPTAFRLFARYSGSAGSIKPGVYEIPRGAGMGDILNRLVAGDVVQMAVVVPEGWTAAQIAQRIAEVTGTAADSIREALFDSVTVREFDVPGPTMEGYLYPATYTVPAGSTPRDIVNAMVRRYRQVWTEDRRARADSLGMSEREVMTLASIVEKEARRWTERDTIAGVFHNRLRIGMPLQADPTVQYALGAHQTRLLYAHIDEVADHPYNTYRRRGLPPGPIASTSTGAVDATLNPAEVPYLYFVARPDGSHIFTRTLAEHNAARVHARRLQEERAAAQAGR